MLKLQINIRQDKFLMLVRLKHHILIIIGQLKKFMNKKNLCQRAVSYGGRLLSDNRVKLGGLESNKENIKKYR